MKSVVLAVALGAMSLACAPTALSQDPRISVQTLMTAEEFARAGLHKLSEAEVAALDDWLERFGRAVAGIGTRTERANAPPRNPSGSGLTISELAGALVIASDGTMLGRITTNCFHAEAICNEFGKYGSEFHAESILNEFGPYGSEFSLKSPFNEFTTSPPRIVREGRVIGYLTKNRALNPRVDPDVLIATLKQ